MVVFYNLLNICTYSKNKQFLTLDKQLYVLLITCKSFLFFFNMFREISDYANVSSNPQAPPCIKTIKLRGGFIKTKW